MNLAPLKLIMISSILLSIAACGGRNKPDRSNQPVSAAEAAAASGPIAPSEVSTEAPSDPNGAIGTEASTEKAVVPYAEEDTEYVGDVAEEVLKQKNASEDQTNAAAKVKNQTPGSLTQKTIEIKSSPKAVPAEKALTWLKNGNIRYVKRRVRSDGQSGADRAGLLSGEKPHTVVFTCSDSRVPPEIVFDQKLGEIYVVRTGQLLVDKTVITSLEKGVALGPQLLVVLSHGGCESDSSKSKEVITSQSTGLAELVKSGELRIQPANYNLKTGVATFD